MSTKLFSLYKTIHKTYKLTYFSINYVKGFHNSTNFRTNSVINGTIKYSTCHENNQIVTYEEVKRISTDKPMNILLIDVREPEELCETGVLPSSINIPLGTLETVLRDVSNEEFKKLYGTDKPSKDCNIVFSCRSGKRSATACEISQQLGFKNVKNYLGGWIDWEERNKK